MRKATKIFISFAVVLIAGLNFIVPAFAQDPFTAIAIGGLSGASGAGLFGSMASMSGIDIGWSQQGTDPMDAMWNVLNPDHVYFSGEKHEADPQDPDDLYDYIQVDIGDWLQAQRAFIDEFVSTYNVTDNDSGNISIPQSVDGVPLSSDLGEGNFGHPAVQSYYSDYGLGYFEFKITGINGTIHYYTLVNHYNGTTETIYQGNASLGQIENKSFCSMLSQNYGNIIANFKINGVVWHSKNLGSKTVTPQVNTSYQSGIVNTSVFDGWESAKVKIPKSISQLQTGWTPVDFFNELDRIWSGAGEDNIIIEDGGDTPVPPVPVPDTPLGDVPFDDWVDLWGQGIYQQLENQSDALDLIGSNGIDVIEELESIDTNTEDLVEVAESIDTNIGVGNGILGGIRSLAQSAVNYLEGIAEHVGELVEEIVEGTETLIAGILNQIPQAFGVIFGPIKQASSIWHYVVEWIQSIDAPFQFIWSMASGTSYYVILPVYASLAAAVVLAFFKRFGR